MEYVRNIALFLVFIAFADNILAIGQMKKYIKLFCGIIVIFLVLQPVNELLGWDMDISKFLEIDGIEQKLEEIDEYTGYEQSALGVIEEQIEGLLLDYGYEITYFHLLPDGNSEAGIGAVNISVRKIKSDIKIESIGLNDIKEETKDMSKLNEEVAKYLGIDTNIVNIVEE